MRIDAYNQISQVYKTNNKVKAQNAYAARANDKVEISDFGKVLQSAKQAVKESSDVREDKIAELKARIENGTYEVSGESFADKLLDDYQLVGKLW